MKASVSDLIKHALGQLADANVLSHEHIPETIKIDRCKDPKHGDFASNIAMVLAKPAGIPPRELAQKLIDSLPSNTDVTHVEIAGPGFINFTVSKDAQTRIIDAILSQGEHFGHTDAGLGERIHIEYVSANPTGPLHVGHGRGAAYGSCVVNLLRACGYQVHNEYYVNDAGRQMHILATSIWLRYLELMGQLHPFPSNGYKGDYVYDIAKQLHTDHGDQFHADIDQVYENVPTDAPEGDKEAHIDALIENAKKILSKHYQIVFDAGLNTILDDIKQDLAEFEVTFDDWFSEKSLETKGLIEHCIDVLTKAGHLFEKDGALWFKTMAFGDDKDRVVRRANGQTTYFASDIAYHLNKLERDYHTVIDVLGADHHGYIQRLKAGMTAMANRGDALVTPIVQFVSLYRGDKKVAMSTRGGDFVTLRELRNEVGNDATRYFYIMRKIDQPLDFDLELAKSRSNDNPIYYIQYAHARICSVWRQLEAAGQVFDITQGKSALGHLTTDAELTLCKTLQRFPEVVWQAAKNYEPHQLAHYLYDLASAYHSVYTSSKFLVEDEDLKQARLCLNKATQQVLANGLTLLGLSAPSEM